MLDSKHKFSGMLVSSLGVKAMLSYPSFSSIRDEATKRYVSEIQAQRVLIKNLSTFFHPPSINMYINGWHAKCHDCLMVSRKTCFITGDGPAARWRIEDRG